MEDDNLLLLMYAYIKQYSTVQADQVFVLFCPTNETKPRGL